MKEKIKGVSRVNLTRCHYVALKNSCRIVIFRGVKV